MDNEFFTKRPKLKVNFKGTKKGKTQQVFSFRTDKNLLSKIKEFKNQYSSKEVAFVIVSGAIRIHKKPAELTDNPLTGKAYVTDLFPSAPKWAEDADTVWGQGFEDTWYVAKPDFSEVVKLKKTKL